MDGNQIMYKNSPTVEPLKSSAEASNQLSKPSSMADISHSRSTAKDGSLPKPPPTAMVAPIVGSSSSNHILSTSSASSITSPSRSPKMTRYGKGYSLEAGLSAPSLGRSHEKASSPGPVTTSQIQSLKNTLNERNKLIERQHLTISQLQQECREKDISLRKLRQTISTSELLGDPSEHNSTTVSAPVKIDMLSRKLDSVYYEVDKTKLELEKTTAQLKDKQTRCSELEKELMKSETNAKELDNKIIQLRGYLSDTPTMEEHYGLKAEVSTLKASCDQLREKLKSREMVVQEMNETIERKNDELSCRGLELERMRSKCRELESQIELCERRICELESTNSMLKSENFKLQENATKFDARLQSELSAMRERHQSRFRDATAKLRDQHKEVVKKYKLLEKQLLKSSDAMTELTTELNHKQGMVGELKTSIQSLLGENQSLLKQNLALQASNIETLRAPSPGGMIGSDTTDMYQRLVQEVTLCTDDMESLVNLVSSMTAGQDPTSSLLFGAQISGSSSTTNKLVEVAASETDVQRQTEIVRKLREEIERLRGVITEHYTQHIASDCNVQ